MVEQQRIDRPYRIAILKDDYALLPLLHGEMAIIDLELAEALSEEFWRTNEKGYVVARKREDKPTRLHHWVVGKPPKGMMVDHINRNKLDNRKENLRFVTPTQNSQNLTLGKHNTSGIQGISFYKKQNSWVVEKTVDGVRVRKYFKTKEDAIIANNKLRETIS